MHNDHSIEARHLHKKYARSLKKTMAYGMVDITKAAFMPRKYRSEHLNARAEDAGENPVRTAPQLRPSEFWALQDVTFNLKRGECLGLIGANGAGKSTLFKVLSGILSPSHGFIRYQGRLTALIEVGSGFHPMLTGRENIYLSGSVLGMGRQEIDKKFDEIVDFSGVEEFLDMPIKFYSSGMHVRLGFAVLAHLEPDIMLIDEILAVGDISFQNKCIARMQKLFENGTTVCLVSHSMYRIEAVSDRVIWMDQGRVKAEGAPGEVIMAYTEDQKRREAGIGERENSASIISHQGFHIHAVCTQQLNGKACNDFNFNEPFRISVRYTAEQAIKRPHFGFVFYHGQTRVFETTMIIDGAAPERIEGEGVISCNVHAKNLLPNAYTVMLHVKDSSGLTDLVPIVKTHEFRVLPAGLESIPAEGPYALSRLSDACLVYQEHTWDLSEAIREPDTTSGIN